MLSPMLEFELRLAIVNDPATSSMFPCIVQFLHLMLKLAGLHESVSSFRQQVSVWCTYILGPEAVICPRDKSGGRMEVSRYCLLMFAVALWLVGV